MELPNRKSRTLWLVNSRIKSENKCRQWFRMLCDHGERWLPLAFGLVRKLILPDLLMLIR